MFFLRRWRPWADREEGFVKIPEKVNKLDLFMAAWEQPDIQEEADKVRAYLFAHKRATERIKSLNLEIKRIHNTLGSSVYKFSDSQRSVFEKLVEANRAECRELVLVRRGHGRDCQTVVITKISQEILKERPDIKLDDWPYEVSQALAEADNLKLTPATPKFVLKIRKLFEVFSQGRRLSTNERDFLIALAALYRKCDESDE